jgi:hypothetical protein
MSISDCKIKARRCELEVFLPDTRGAFISRWGRGNLKIGPNVFTYSKLPGRPEDGGTCPGARECLEYCYSLRIRATTPLVWQVYKENTLNGPSLPSLPGEAALVRLHVTGDFDTVAYIEAWIALVKKHPDVYFWAYTRSWRVPSLLPALERLRALPNIQLFASIDRTGQDLPPATWRRAYVLPPGPMSEASYVLARGRLAYVCPEEQGRKPNCESCLYCVRGRKGDVAFVQH